MRRQTQDTETYWCFGFQPIHPREVCRSEDDTTSTNFSSSRPTSSILNLFRAACRPVTESGEVLDRRDPHRFRFIGCCPAPIPPVTVSDTRPVHNRSPCTRCPQLCQVFSAPVPSTQDVSSEKVSRSFVQPKLYLQASLAKRFADATRGGLSLNPWWCDNHPNDPECPFKV